MSCYTTAVVATMSQQLMRCYNSAMATTTSQRMSCDNNVPTSHEVERIRDSQAHVSNESADEGVSCVVATACCRGVMADERSDNVSLRRAFRFRLEDFTLIVNRIKVNSSKELYPNVWIILLRYGQIWPRACTHKAHYRVISLIRNRPPPPQGPRRALDTVLL